MRQLIFQVPRGQGEQVLEVAKTYKGVHLSRFEAKNESEPVEIAIVHIANSRVEDLLQELESVPDLQVSLFPQGVITLKPPPSEAPDQVIDVKQRSPLEVFLSGLQSVGSWWGFLSYAALAGIVVWIGLFTNTSYLLVAAMLIAPFAGPAMNLAIATARGDSKLVGRSLIRYFSAIAVTVAVSALLSWLLQQQVATQMMIDISKVSAVSVLLPLAAGAAGGIHLIQSERSSLVSGAAVGLLVAASLAPPTGIVGMALAMQRYDLIQGAAFLLLIQLAGINLSATLVFRLRGMSVEGARYKRGKKRLFPISLTITVLALGALLLWQFSNPPVLQRPSTAQEAHAVVQNVVDQAQEVFLVDANMNFTRAQIPGQNTLLCQVYVQKKADVALADSVIQADLRSRIRESLMEEGFNITPLIQVNVFDSPEE
ncbi:DUF389 domain-containing protein [Catalinimonas niigatensis]|uniref:DUF389 domain-containing protein n=1 Tax=Catalinimonas niigatensis TaxID=1397264 RepID=UPI0026654724|nr:DUF389 domain-containing protein [Catalinimonas niigatensis]WPP52714.1 DUF389 domain-containing protein [Catalinimonas niigatensis]